jgi:hypothetical protein
MNNNIIDIYKMVNNSQNTVQVEFFKAYKD